MTEDQKRMYDKHIEHGDDMTYENEGDRDMSPMVRISLKEYDKLKERGKYITDRDMIACIDKIEELGRPELLSFFPWSWSSNGINWIEDAGISMATFFAFLSLQWWSFRRSDGGGEFIQRMLATKDERNSQIASWVFLVINYLIRSWLWILVGLSGLVLIPSQQDWELSYPLLAIKFLPPVLFFLGCPQ